MMQKLTLLATLVNIVVMTKKIIFSVLFILLAAAGLLVYYNEQSTPADKAESPVVYSSIDVYNKDQKLLGNIKIENKKVISSVEDAKLKAFIDTNKTLWETTKLEHPWEERSKDGSSLLGSVNTSIEDKGHIISIFVLLDKEFGKDYNFDLVK